MVHPGTDHFPMQRLLPHFWGQIYTGILQSGATGLTFPSSIKRGSLFTPLQVLLLNSSSSILLWQFCHLPVKEKMLAVLQWGPNSLFCNSELYFAVQICTKISFLPWRVCSLRTGMRVCTTKSMVHYRADQLCSQTNRLLTATFFFFFFYFPHMWLTLG